MSRIFRRSSYLSGRTNTDVPKRDRGAVSLEFAILLPLILLIVLGMLDLGRFLVVRLALNGAAEQGARAIAYGATTSTASSIVRGAVSVRIIHLGTLNNTTDANSITPGYWTCPANSESVSDATCISYTSPNYSTYSCTGTSGTNYRAKASAYLDFKWLTPLVFLFQYLDPNAQAVGIADTNRDTYGITAYSKSICQN